VADIGIPPDLCADVELEMATPAQIANLLPARPVGGHKGTFGWAMVVAGSVNYTGAATLAGTAAARAGAGLVTLDCPQTIHRSVARPAERGDLPAAARRYRCLGARGGQGADRKIGELRGVAPGSRPGAGEADRGIYRRAVWRPQNGSPAARGFAHQGDEDAPEQESSKLPALIVDADGLNCWQKRDKWWERLPAGSVLTPHPGEMARLMGKHDAGGSRPTGWGAPPRWLPSGATWSC